MKQYWIICGPPNCPSDTWYFIFCQAIFKVCIQFKWGYMLHWYRTNYDQPYTLPCSFSRI